MTLIYDIRNFFLVGKKWNDLSNHIEICLKFNPIFHLCYDFFLSFYILIVLIINFDSGEYTIISFENTSFIARCYLHYVRDKKSLIQCYNEARKAL